MQETGLKKPMHVAPVPTVCAIAIGIHSGTASNPFCLVWTQF